MFNLDKEKILPEFLLAYFSSPYIWESLKRKVTGIGGGAGNRRIRLKEKVFLQQQIWLPPLVWQRKVKTVAEKLTAQKRGSALVSRELDALLPSILDRAFSGAL